MVRLQGGLRVVSCLPHLLLRDPCSLSSGHVSPGSSENSLDPPCHQCPGAYPRHSSAGQTRAGCLLCDRPRSMYWECYTEQNQAPGLIHQRPLPSPPSPAPAAPASLPFISPTRHTPAITQAVASGRLALPHFTQVSLQMMLLDHLWSRDGPSPATPFQIAPHTRKCQGP